ncbi:storkhead-box protein 1-like [Heterodontus francisci]|uniref:storkhead-box protein 1-like n=1 Tax=Heterodontus francisci TaxID=7792 RepID=UPI00355B8EB9
MSVQLAPSSLGLVLGAREAASDIELELGRSGQQLLADLKAENGLSVWNGRLVEAVSGLLLLGWLERCVLLVFFLSGCASTGVMYDKVNIFACYRLFSSLHQPFSHPSPVTQPAANLHMAQPGDQSWFNEEGRIACQEQHQAYLKMRYQPGEAATQDYMHGKQWTQHAIDRAKRSHNQQIRSKLCSPATTSRDIKKQLMALNTARAMGPDNILAVVRVLTAQKEAIQPIESILAFCRAIQSIPFSGSIPVALTSYAFSQAVLVQLNAGVCTTIWKIAQITLTVAVWVGEVFFPAADTPDGAVPLLLSSSGYLPSGTFSEVQTLTGVQFLKASPITGVQFLKVSPVTGVQFLKVSPVTWVLPITGVQFQNLSPVTGVQFLKVSPVTGVQFLKVSPVTGLLKVLTFSGVQFLKVLTFSGVQFLKVLTVTEVQFLKVLTLTGVWFLKVSPITRVQFLNLSPVTGVQFLKVSPVTGVQFLSVSPVTGVSPVAGVQFLKTLTITWVQFLKVSPVTGVQFLSVLPITEVQFRKVSPVTGVQFLSVLPITGVQFRKVSPVTGVHFLKVLLLAGVQFLCVFWKISEALYGLCYSTADRFLNSIQTVHPPQTGPVFKCGPLLIPNNASSGTSLEVCVSHTAALNAGPNSIGNYINCVEPAGRKANCLYNVDCNVIWSGLVLAESKLSICDVSPIPMAPIAQSQFVPLAEVLCCVISEMNTSHITVNQEALMEYLVKCYPGIATPSQEILHNALGLLIQDRKIYHTGEGYFIVTPHTYFITSNMGKQSHPWVLDEDRASSQPPITYLVSVENCEDPVKEKDLPEAPHCKSCRCFSQQEVEQQPDQRLSNEGTGLGQGSCREPRPSVQNRATSTLVGHQEIELSSAKEKENPFRKFGLSLFRRNTKKESPKRVYRTFSAQFPPEEWPVRDEASLGNIPREVEHQLIKCINPRLTVDNLIRHTLLMKKQGKENTAHCHSTSMEQLLAKQRHHSKDSPQKAPARSQQQRTARSSREKKKMKRRGSLQASEGLLRPGSGPRLKEMAKPRRNEGDQPLPEEPKAQPCRSSTPTTHVYKKRIDKPFSGVPSVKHHRSQKTRLKSPRSEECARVGRKSQSHSTRADGMLSVKESPQEKFKPNAGRYLRPGEEDSMDHPESCAVRAECRHRGYTCHSIPNGCQALDRPRKSQTPGSPTDDHITNHVHHCVQAAGRAHQEQEREEHIHVTRQEVSHEYGDGPVPHTWQDQAPKLAQNPAVPIIVNPESVERLPSQSHTSRAQLLPHAQACQPEGGAASEPETDGGQSETFTDDDQTLYQRELDEDDACSSLYLNDDAEIMPCSQLSTTLAGLGCTDDPGSEGVPAMLANESWVLTKILLEEQQTANSEFGEKQVTGWLKASNGSLGQSKTWCGTEQLHRYQPMSQLADEHLEEEEHPSGCGEVADLLESHIFDYCNVTGADPDPEILRDPSSEGTPNPAGQELWTMHQGMKAQLMRNLERNLGFLHHSHNTALSQTGQEDQTHLETLENHSITGDSGIDSPRTRVSLASNNSIVLDSLKHRSLMQNYGTLNSVGRSRVLSQHPLLQLTPVMNV